jgi:hypothetical protein
MTILEKPSKFYTTEVSIFNRDGGLIIPPVSRVSGVQVRLWMQVQAVDEVDVVGLVVSPNW